MPEVVAHIYREREMGDQHAWKATTVATTFAAQKEVPLAGFSSDHSVRGIWENPETRAGARETGAPSISARAGAVRCAVIRDSRKEQSFRIYFLSGGAEKRCRRRGHAPPGRR